MMPDLQHDPLALRQEYFAKNLQMVGAMHRAGVPFLAGTDSAPRASTCYQDSACTMSWLKFVEAGFTPMESLQTATSNPAKFLRGGKLLRIGGKRESSGPGGTQREPAQRHSQRRRDFRGDRQRAPVPARRSGPDAGGRRAARAKSREPFGGLHGLLGRLAARGPLSCASRQGREVQPPASEGKRRAARGMSRAAGGRVGEGGVKRQGTNW